MQISKLTVEKDTTLTKLSKNLGIEKDAFFIALKIGGILVNNKRINKHNYRLSKGDSVSICHGATPPDVSFDKNWVIFEDDYFICLNKPAGIPTQGTRCFDVNHLYYFAKEYVNNYVGLHHRLDTFTSGLVLFTKDKKVNKYTADLFEKKQIEKQYLAVVHGCFEKDMVIDKPIGKLQGLEKAKFWVNTQDAKKSITEVKVINSNSSFSLLKVFLKTGRTHQIRVHLASIGFPVVGDLFYNKNETFRNLRQLLHCQSLEFKHPISKKICKIEVAPPEDFQTFIGKYLESDL